MASGFAFYNTSRYDFEKLLADAPHLAANLRNYIAGFSPNMREVLERFDFDNTISKLDESGLLFQVLDRFKNVDLHPEKVDNPTMGTVFEELIRKFNEALNENPGEHFTPRDVVHLMVDLMIAGDETRIRTRGVVLSVYDPCCGSGGMLMITKEHVTVGVRKNGEQEQVVVSRIFPTTHFGFRKITVERPLRLSFQASPERIARLDEERGFQALAQSKKKGVAGEKERAAGHAEQEAIRKLVRTLPDKLYKDREEFERVLEAAAKKAGLKLAAPVRKAILSALSERDETAPICHYREGNPEPDPELRDTESVPLAESLEAFFAREVTPHVPDAWIDTERRDPKDGQVGIVGYEINFNRYFYQYRTPRPLEEIEADIRAIEGDIVRMLAEVTSRLPATR